MTTPHHDTFTHRSGNDADSVLPQFPAQEFSTEKFTSRHLGLTEDDRAEMLRVIGYDSVESLLDATVPASIRMRMPIAIPSATSEHEVLSELRTLFSNDIKRHSFIGQGYYNTITPPVVKRNVLENPSWYTAYTPYQPEISQGRLEALLNYQTMVCQITGLPLANASLLDESTAVAEAVAMAHRISSSDSRSVFVDSNTHPQTINVLCTRMSPIDVEVHVADISTYEASRHFAVVVSYPGSDGHVMNVNQIRSITARAHESNALAIAVTDLLGLHHSCAARTIGL
jgi:glycine dehydrogenase